MSLNTCLCYLLSSFCSVDSLSDAITFNGNKPNHSGLHSKIRPTLHLFTSLYCLSNGSIDVANRVFLRSWLKICRFIYFFFRSRRQGNDYWVKTSPTSSSSPSARHHAAASGSANHPESKVNGTRRLFSFVLPLTHHGLLSFFVF